MADDMRGGNVEFQTVKSEEIKFGKNNFLEIARKKAITQDGENEFLAISRGFFLPDGTKRFKKSIADRRPGLAFLWGVILIFGLVLIGLSQGRLVTWANAQIDASAESTMNYILAFVASDTFLLSLVGVFVSLWATTFMILFAPCAFRRVALHYRLSSVDWCTG